MRIHHGCGARVFITLLGGTAAWPLAANAQRSGRMQRIGFISAMAEKDPQGQLNVLAFQKGLLERGLNVGGSDRGGERAAVMLTLIQTAKLNNVDPQAWLADMLARLPGHPAKHMHELLPWNWKANPTKLAA
jgi:IS66 C-terminal element